MWRSMQQQAVANIRCYSNYITIVYIIPDVGATKHGLITKISDKDKCACPLSTKYNNYVDTNII